MTQELKNVKLTGKAFEVDNLPEEIKELIGGFSRAVIMPIQEEKTSVMIDGKEHSLRDIMVKDCTEGEESCYIKALDRCAGMADMAYESLEKHGVVNVEYLRWIRQLYEVSFSEFPSVYRIEDSAINVTFDNYTNNKYEELLNIVYNLADKDISKDSIHSTMFRWNVVKIDGLYKLVEVNELDGITLYIHNCLQYDKYVAIQPLDDYFTLLTMEDYNDYRHSYAASKRIASRLEGRNKEFSDVAYNVVNNIYDSNLKLYLNIEMGFYMMCEYDNNKVRAFDFYEEWFGYGSVIDE